MRSSKRSRMFIGIVMAIAIAVPVTARADVFSEWNVIVIRENGVAGRPGGAGAIDIATMHAAMYDAVQAIEKDYEPYRITDVPNAGGSSIAAAAKAARDVLVARFPVQARIDLINADYLNTLAANGLAPNDPGVAVGAYVAEKILAFRSCEGSLPVPTAFFTGGMGIGEWRPTTIGAAMHPGPYLGQMTPFMMTRPTQFRPDPPPAVTSRHYARDYKEVKLYGAKTGSLRSPEQTDMAQFWAGNTFAAVYSGVRNVALANVTDVSDSSRLYALVALTMGDTLIGVWDSKYHYNYWRPITAIRMGDSDGNEWTEGDADWDSLITNPPYPDYTSGANGVSSSAMYAMTHFFGTDEMEFDMTTTNVNNTNVDTRHYTSFSQAMQEVVDARVLLGIHFRFADEAARTLGRDVAKWGHNNYLRPRRGSGNY